MFFNHCGAIPQSSIDVEYNVYDSMISRMQAEFISVGHTYHMT